MSSPEELKQVFLQAITSLGVTDADVTAKTQSASIAQPLEGLRFAAEAVTLAVVQLEDASSVMETIELIFKKAKVAAKVLKDAGSKVGAAYALNAVATVQLIKQTHEKAIKAAKEAIDLFREADNSDKAGEAMCWRTIKEAYLFKANKVMGSGDRAKIDILPPERIRNFLELSQKLLLESAAAANEMCECYRELGDRKKEVLCLLDMHDIYMNDEDTYEEAKAVAKEAAALSRFMKYPEGEAEALYKSSNTSCALGEGVEALEAVKSAVSVWQRAANKKEEAMALRAVMNVHFQLGENAPMTAVGNEAIKIFQSVSDKGGEASIHQNFMAMYLAEAGVILTNPGELEQAEVDTSWDAKMKEALASASTMLNLWQSTGDKSGTAGAMQAVASVRLELFFKEYETIVGQIKALQANRGTAGEDPGAVDVEEHAACLKLLEDAGKMFEEVGDAAGQQSVSQQISDAADRALMSAEPTEIRYIVNKHGEVQDTIYSWDPSLLAEGAEATVVETLRPKAPDVEDTTREF